MTMPTVQLAPAMPAMGRIVYGAWRLGDDTDVSPAHVARKIDLCLDQGIDTFDHADIYGGYACEPLFGAAVRARPDLKSRIRVVTKCGIMLVSPDYPERRVKHYDTSAAHVTASAEASLRRLGVDVIDLLLIHRPDPFMDHRETGAALDALVERGLVRGVGVSNFLPHDVDLLQSAMKNPILTNQVEISLLHHDSFLNGQVAQMQRLGRPPMAWSPLGGGSLFFGDDPAAHRLAPRLREIARDHGVASEAVALAWIMAHPAGIMPVVGTNNIERIGRISESLKVGMDRQTWYELWTLAEGRDVP